MTAEIDKTVEALNQLFVARRSDLKLKSDEQLRDLLHYCEDRKRDERWTVRTACEINSAAATILLEERA